MTPVITATAASFAPTEADWKSRLDLDAQQISRALPGRLRDLHDAVVSRAEQADARGLVLTGSTARRRRTEISDLDYLLIGERIVTRDLSLEVDVHVASPQKLRQEILRGDDFVQWSLRFGCIVFDRGPLFEAMELTTARQPWPDPLRKLGQARKSVDLAGRFIESGDEDAALVQVRTALSLSARAHLLSLGVFPLARAELPDQLAAVGCVGAANALSAVVHGAPDLEGLCLALAEADPLLVADGDG